MMIKRFGIPIILSAALTAGALAGCAGTASASPSAGAQESMSAPSAMSQSMGSATAAVSAPSSAASGAMLDTTSLFTDRDLEQTADTSSAKEITVSDGQDVSITEEGVYVISGTASDCTITVNADSAAKVQLVLDGVSITNTDAAAIYVQSADKVFVTTANGTTNTLTVSGQFAAVGEDNVDGAIFAKDDLVLNGEGTLVVKSSDNGIVGKDDVKVTGGTYEIAATGHGIEGKDIVAISDGTFKIEAETDAIHAENSDDDSLGSVYVVGGTFELKTGSDGIEGDAVVQIDGGTLTMDSAEGIEGTYVQINGGTVNIQASDDGINATTKSTSYDVALEINGGSITVNMGQGDTDALDSNGSLFITGGDVNITAQSAFDFDGTGSMTGGTVTVNGEQITELTNSMMGPGGGMGGRGGQGGAQNGSQGSMGGRSGGPGGSMGSKQA